MNNMIKIGINTVTPSGIKESLGKELKLSLGEIVSARVEAGGKGEAVIKIKGYEIEAKGAKEFKNGEVISLRVKGMENGKLLVEDLKADNRKTELKEGTRAVENSKLKESIIKEIVEQKGSFSADKLDKIVVNFQKIESEIKKSLEKQIRNEYNIENKEENGKEGNILQEENKSSEKTDDKKNEYQINEMKDKKTETVSLKENNPEDIKGENGYIGNKKIEIKLNEKTDFKENEIKSDKNKNSFEKGENKLETKLVIKENILKEQGKERENETDVNIKEKKINEKIKPDEKEQITRYYMDSKEESHKSSEILSNKIIKRELIEKYKVTQPILINDEKEVKKPEKEIAEFITENRAENMKNGIIKTLVKLENAETGLNPELFKKVFQFYDIEKTAVIDERENGEEGIKSYIKNISEGKDIKSESTTIVNVLNKMEDKNTLEFMVNSNLFKNAAEIKINSEESKDKEGKKIKINYMTINLELEKIGKMAVSVVLAEKNRANISFYVSKDKIKESIKCDKDDIRERFLEKGISVENINIKDLKEEEEKSSINCKI